MTSWSSTTYLHLKATLQILLPWYALIKEADIYGDREPWQMWEDWATPSQDLYFFTTLKKKSKKSSRIDRSVGGNGGTWHAVDRGILKKAEGISYFLKRFLYENSRNPADDGSWIMHEFSLADTPTTLVLCRIRMNQRNHKEQKKSEAREWECRIVEESAVAPESCNYMCLSPQQDCHGADHHGAVPNFTSEELAWLASIFPAEET